MKNSEFYQKIKRHIDAEVETAVELIKTGNLQTAFYHLERAHVLGQSITMEHTRVHWLMLKIGWKQRNAREIFGQIVRIVGAFTKTPFGIYPNGNTGGANVWFFKPMPVPNDLQKIISQAKNYRLGLEKSKYDC
ncbi:MAG TPA: DUF3703 domain-containing protein [Pyrinomonadaceae bacterium]|nr:DUF3703 domain-containing protein [Pyrinomonadaceae bacterium]